MDKIIGELIYSYHIKKIDDHNFTVIANYFESLEQIATKYNLQLVEKIEDNRNFKNTVPAVITPPPAAEAYIFRNSDHV